jgi:hypothetical protein
MNVLAVEIGKQINWAVKCGNIRITGSTACLLDWLPIMIKAYAIDLVVFNTMRRKIFHGFQRKFCAQLHGALKICESQNVATKCLNNRVTARFLRGYKSAGGLDFATKIFAILMLAENKSVTESIDITRLMRARNKKISIGLGAIA